MSASQDIPANPTATTSISPTVSATDKAAKRTSGLKGLLNKLKSSRTPKSTSRVNSMNSSGAQTPTTVATTEDGSHPGGIIPAGSSSAGNEPVQPMSPVHETGGGALNEVDILLTKEAEKIMQAMSNMVENSANTEPSGDVPLNIRATLYPHDSESHDMTMPTPKWLANWSASFLEKVFAAHKMGVYVIVDRKTGAKVFETMPVFTRLGMHLLFVTVNHEILDLKAVEKLFADISIRQGKIYDNPDPLFVVPHIETFVKTYGIDMSQLLETDVKKYKTFNDFFSRQLTPAARPVSEANDLTVITSPADSRLTVFRSVGDAKKFWIKGQKFTLASLLDDKHLAETFGANPSIAICRLAPQDYHRFHSPFQAVLGKQFHVSGTYFTVNPQAVNEDLNVFTANRRDVQLLSATLGPAETTAPVTFAFVAVGAMLVGSIGWSKRGGEGVMKGEDVGYFQYGGSTTILIAPDGAVEWDADLLKNSESGVETLVKVGERIGKALGSTRP